MSRLRIWRILTVLLILISGFSVNAVEIFISPNGNDSGKGTLEKPFKTFERVQEEVLKLKAKTDENITIQVRGGVYRIAETVRFSPMDGGENNQQIIYKAYNNETPVISGGIETGGFEKETEKIWKSKLELDDFRELYVGKSRGIRARMPNKGEYFRVYMWDKGSKNLYIKAEEIEGYELSKNLEMEIMMNWAGNKFRIESVEFTNDEPSNWTNPRYARIKFEEPEDSLIYSRDYPPKRPDLAYHLENDFGFIDQPYEWFYNKTTKILYIMADKGDDICDFTVTMPVIDTLFDIAGNENETVANLQFEGLTFSHNKWLGPSQHGFSHIQSGNYNVKAIEKIERLPAAVCVRWARHIQFNNNVFHQIGTSALDFYEGVQHSVINGNLFYNVGGSGIIMAKFSEGLGDIHFTYLPKSESERCQFNTISNNRFDNVGIEYLGTAAIGVGYGNDISIENNYISNVPWMGITFGWGWNPEPNAMKNNRINKNKIINACDLLCDCGGIYTLSAQPNSNINENYIAKIDKSKWACATSNVGIYTDEGTTGYTIENNHIEEVPDEKLKTKGDVAVKFNYIMHPEVKENAGLKKDYAGLLENKLNQLKPLF